MKLRFGDCTLDIETRRLFRGDEEVHLSPKAFELLRLLIEHRDRALSKAELLEHVWTGVSVSDASLTRTVTEIREAVGDAAREAHIIRTVHAYGYAFSAKVEHAESGPPVAGAAGASCWIVWRKRAFALSQGAHFVGREPGVTVWLDSPKVSRHHARVVVTGAKATIEDLGSKNGTMVRGARISSPVGLESGDEIRIGPFRLSFRVGSGQATTESEVHST